VSNADRLRAPIMPATMCLPSGVTYTLCTPPSVGTLTGARTSTPPYLTAVLTPSDPNR
jgi:hypothetical protein